MKEGETKFEHKTMKEGEGVGGGGGHLSWASSGIF